MERESSEEVEGDESEEEETPEAEDDQSVNSQLSGVEYRR